MLRLLDDGDGESPPPDHQEINGSSALPREKEVEIHASFDGVPSKTLLVRL